jgi:hypothetical protein
MPDPQGCLYVKAPDGTLIPLRGAQGPAGPAGDPADSLAFLDTVYPGWQPYDPAATYAEGALVFNDGLIWKAPTGGVNPGDSEPPTAENGGDWFFGPFTLMSTSAFVDSVSDIAADASSEAGTAKEIAEAAVPMDPTNVIHLWNANTAYKAGQVCRVYGANGEKLYFSSDIDQSGGEAPSPTNVQTWTRVSGIGMLGNPYLFWHPLDHLQDVTAPADTPAGKVLGTTAVGAWGPIDAPDSLAALDVVYPGWRPYDPTVTYEEGDLVFNDGLIWQARGTIAPGDSEPPTAANNGDQFYGPYDLIGTSDFLDSVSDRAIEAFNLANQAMGIGQSAIPMDFKNIIRNWSASTAYTAGNVVKVWDESKHTYGYYSSDIAQTGGESPSPTNLATWTLIDGTNILHTPSLFFHPLDHLQDVTAPADTPVGKVLGTTATGAWGPIDPPAPTADHNIDEVVYAMTANAGIWPWGGGMTWGPGSYVMHNDRLWYNATAAPSSEVPGVSSLWQDVTLAALAEVAVGPTEPTDPNIKVWINPAENGNWGPPIWSGTRAAYDAIATKDPLTLYVITGA